MYTLANTKIRSYGVATISRLLKIIGLFWSFLQNVVSFIGHFCKRDL